MRNIHIMSGIPASGKSTYIEDRQRGAKWGDIVLHRDEFRDCLRRALDTEEYFPCPTDHEWRYWIGHVNSHLIQAHNVDVWIDQTTNGTGALKKLYDALFITKNDYLVIHIFETPYSECLARNAQREGRARVPEKTMASMHEGFTNKMITFDGILENVTNVVDRIRIIRHRGGEEYEDICPKR